MRPNKFFMADPNSTISVFLRNNGYEEVTDNTADFVVFGGGADVNPGFYGQTQNPKTFTAPTRDVVDVCAFTRFRDIPKVGICRGFQFLSVMCGAELKQHIEGHSGASHEVVDIRNGETLEVTSTHHQCVAIPTFDDFELIYVSPDDGVCEGGIFWKNKVFGVQFHPEYGTAPDVSKKAFISNLGKFLEKAYAD